MKIDKIEETIELPEGVSATLENARLTMKGPKGEVSRVFLSKRVSIVINGNKISFVAENITRREKKILFTFKAHVANMARGVAEGHTYRLKICSGHFPMNVSVKGVAFEIKNFIGEAVPRTMPITQGVDVKVEGDIITVSGIEKENVAQVAARIENLTRRPGFDSRIFQDGVYIIEKDGKLIG